MCRNIEKKVARRYSFIFFSFSAREHISRRKMTMSFDSTAMRVTLYHGADDDDANDDDTIMTGTSMSSRASTMTARCVVNRMRRR